MKNSSIKKAVFAGVIGTVVMTLTALAAPVMGLPEMNIPKMLSGTMGTPVIAGWAAHFMIGITLAVSYAVIFYNKLPGSTVIKGMLFSIIPWLMSQLIVMPMMSAVNGMSFIDGIFSGSISLAAGSLLGHLMYGITLGIIYNRGSVKDELVHSFAGAK